MCHVEPLCTTTVYTCMENGILHYSALYSNVLYCTYCTMVLYCTELYCIVLFCTKLYCTVLYYIALYCTVLYCMCCLPVSLSEGESCGHLQSIDIVSFMKKLRQCYVAVLSSLAGCPHFHIHVIVLFETCRGQSRASSVWLQCCEDHHSCLDT